MICQQNIFFQNLHPGALSGIDSMLPEMGVTQTGPDKATVITSEGGILGNYN